MLKYHWSWSVGSVPSPKSVASWVLCRGLGKTLDEMTVTIPHDLYVFGSQENSVCDREWVETLRVVLKEQTELDYKPVRKEIGILLFEILTVAPLWYIIALFDDISCFNSKKLIINL